MDRILLLEDDASLIDGLTYSLKKNGFEVDVSRTVSEAKQHLSDLGNYVLLILDVSLPDGTIRGVRESEEGKPANPNHFPDRIG